MKKDLQYYLKLPYSYSINWSDVDQCYLGSIAEIEKNMTCGETPEETMSNLKDALKAYIKTSLDNKMPIPEPIRIGKYKGTITYRTTSTKHYYIVQFANDLGISVNALIDEAVDEKLKRKQLSY